MCVGKCASSKGQTVYDGTLGRTETHLVSSRRFIFILESLVQVLLALSLRRIKIAARARETGYFAIESVLL